MSLDLDEDGKPKVTWHNFFVAAVTYLLGFASLMAKVAVATWVVHEVWF